MTAIFLGVGGALQPDLYVDAARPAVLTGAAVLFAAAVTGLWLPSGRAARGGAGTDAATAADPQPELVEA